jgi:signal transduction histidine kinase/DNA-binding response OmpR family regulator/ligand-binding sensor domain-containing protein
MKKTAFLFVFALISFLSTVSCRKGDDAYKVSTDEEVVIANDISNQFISSFAEDHLGHIWIGTLRGLNKYNAHEFHRYFNTDDSLSLCNNQIRQIYKDSQNRLWIATSNGICLYTDKGHFRKIPIESYTQNVIQILEDKNGRIFLNMVEQLCEYRPEEDKFVVVIPEFKIDWDWNIRCFIDKNGNLWSVSSFSIRCFNTSNFELISRIAAKSYIHYSFLCDNGELWLASGNTLFIFDTKSGRFKDVPGIIRKHPLLSESMIDYIHPCPDSSLLLITRKGFFLYSVFTGSIVHQSEAGFPFQAPAFRVTAMFTDSQKNLWIGSSDQGFVTRYNDKERFNNNNYLSSHIQGKSVVSVATDLHDNLWMLTSMDDIFRYDASNKKIQAIDIRKFFPEEKFFQNRVSRIFIDDENYIWLITEISKIIKCRYENGRLYRENEFWFPSSIYCMTQTKNGSIYAAGFSENMFVLHKGENEFQTISLYPPNFVFTSGLITLSTGELLIASFSRNLRIISEDGKHSEEIELLKHIKRSVFIPTVLFEDSRGDIWIGANTNGLFRYSVKTKEIESMEGMACPDITAIQEDRDGNVWASTLYGLSKYDRATNKFTNYYKSDGIGGNQFNERSSSRTSNGTLIFGGTHGLTFFNPADDMIAKRKIPLLFEDLKIHNQLILPYRSHCIDKSLSYNPVIRLKHFQNTFTLSFTALDYREYERVHYYYRMEGFEKIWRDANNNREAYYSNLPTGKYIFRVKITNNDKTIVEAENAIPIIVSAPPWFSWWANCIYLVILGFIVLLTAGMRRKIRTNKKAVLLAKREQEQEKRINAMNMSFFTNISHEFRTPLTMISGPVEQLCNDAAITGENKKLLYIIQRSVNRMLKLINQLMDFSKLENDALKLKVKQMNIVSELIQIIDIFRLNANNKNVGLQTYGLEDSFVTWIDGDKLNKIMSNLISNALKFTYSGGKISLLFDVIQRKEASLLFPLTEKDIGTEYVKLVLSDTGRGIPEDKLEKIFERYYQIIDQDKGRYNWGAGIGLYYSRCLVELHHGRIKAMNKEEGGSMFIIILPINESAYSPEEKEMETEVQNEVFPLQTREQLGEMKESGTQEEHKLLVVDDDTEVSHYLNTLLSPYYKVISRFDADSAMKAVEEELPDLILSDVLMPGISGYELCRKIKDDLQLCHIPVVLVTAKATVENQVEGLNTGADAYVTKPFDPDYLLALIKSQLKNRENVRKLLGKKTKTDKMDKDILSPQDKSFMTELYHLMETGLSNTELNITRMTEVLKISRTKLYYKIKGLTGMNPNVFFKTYKLNRAAELLLEGRYNISEIADITGFSTLSHFSSSFRKQFGVSPSEYTGE